MWKMAFALSAHHVANSATFLLLVAAIPLVPAVHAQASTSSVGCGKANVSMANPTYLSAGSVILAVELPSGWLREEKKSNPFFLLRVGDRYESAPTLMYINVQRLDSSFEQAVKNDERDFRQSDPSAQILDEPAPAVLEAGCPVNTQRFVYQHEQKTYIDQVTKIGIDGLLLNVVLSSDSEAEITRYQKDYMFLLQHLALVASAH
jgi:hypothetical protein